MEERVIRTRGLYKVFPRKGGAAQTATHYCPGCEHGVLHKLIGEALAELGLQDRAVVISPVGCSVFAYYYFDAGNIQVAHGRAGAAATGLSRVRDDAVVVSYQGDGDLASIGLNETLQAANRGEKVAVFFVNNTVYGMTGGQMAPTTLIGERTETTPNGRDPRQAGYPLHMAELINQLKAPVYVARVSFADMPRLRRARGVIRKALEIQRDRKGYAFVEVLMACPTNLKLDAAGAAKFVMEQMEVEFPPGVLRDRSGEAEAFCRPGSDYRKETLDGLYDLENEQAPDAIQDPGAAIHAVKMAGFGGQGVLSMGVLLARAACAAGKNVSWYPSYGPEQRGGTANCAVVISGQRVGSPVIAHPTVLVAMNRPSLEKFAGDVVGGGWILYDAAMGEVDKRGDVRMVAVPAHDLAIRGGSARATNTAMLGVMAGLAGFGLEDRFYLDAIARNFSSKPKLIPVNEKVFAAGKAWGVAHLG